MTADIEKAYLQINVEEKHLDYIGVLWFEDIFASGPKIQKYRFSDIWCYIVAVSAYATIRAHPPIRAHANN